MAENGVTGGGGHRGGAVPAQQEYERRLAVFAAELRQLRLDRGNLPYRDLARRAKAVRGMRDLAPGTVSPILQGKRLPRLDVLIALVRVLLAYDMYGEFGAVPDRDHPEVGTWHSRWRELEALRCALPGPVRRATGAPGGGGTASASAPDASHPTAGPASGAARATGGTAVADGGRGSTGSGGPAPGSGPPDGGSPGTTVLSRGTDGANAPLPAAPAPAVRQGWGIPSALARAPESGTTGTPPSSPAPAKSRPRWDMPPQDPAPAARPDPAPSPVASGESPPVPVLGRALGEWAAQRTAGRDPYGQGTGPVGHDGPATGREEPHRATSPEDASAPAPVPRQAAPPPAGYSPAPSPVTGPVPPPVGTPAPGFAASRPPAGYAPAPSPGSGPTPPADGHVREPRHSAPSPNPFPPPGGHRIGSQRPTPSPTLGPMPPAGGSPAAPPDDASGPAAGPRGTWPASPHPVPPVGTAASFRTAAEQAAAALHGTTHPVEPPPGEALPPAARSTPSLPAAAPPGAPAPYGSPDPGGPYRSADPAGEEGSDDRRLRIRTEPPAKRTALAASPERDHDGTPVTYARTRTLTLHDIAIAQVAFSPDGQVLATADQRGTVWLWEGDDPAPGGTFRTKGGNPRSLVFLSDGRLATTGFDSVRLRTIESQEPGLFLSPGHGRPVHAVAFSPDGELLASVGTHAVAWAATGTAAHPDPDIRIRLTEVATGASFPLPRDLSEGVRDLVFSPDGDLLASCGSQSVIHLQEVGTPGRTWTVHQLPGATDGHRCAAFSPDGQWLAAAATRGGVHLWHTRSLRHLRAPDLESAPLVHALAFSPAGGVLATAHEDGTVQLWETENWQPMGLPLSRSGSAVNAVAFSADGRLLAAGDADGAVVVFTRESAAAAAPKAVPDQPLAARAALGALDHGHVLPLPPLSGHAGAVNSLRFSPAGDVLASAGHDRIIRFWDVAGLTESGQALTGHTEPVRDLAFDPTGELLVSVGQNKTVRMWDTEARRRFGRPLAGHTDWVLAAAFAPGGRLFATAGADNEIRFWNPAARRASGGPMTGHTDTIRALAFSPDGTLLASAGRDSALRLWLTESRQPYGNPLEGHSGTVYAVAFAPVRALVATAGGDKTVRVWDLDVWPARATVLSGHTAGVRAVAFSPSGRLLASAGTDSTVILWDADTLRRIGEPLTGHTSRIRTLAFSPDGTVLATADNAGTIRLWLVPTRPPAPRTTYGGSYRGGGSSTGL
jgi:WD40 repeat protein